MATHLDKNFVHLFMNDTFEKLNLTHASDAIWPTANNNTNAKGYSFRQFAIYCDTTSEFSKDLEENIPEMVQLINGGHTQVAINKHSIHLCGFTNRYRFHFYLINPK